MSERNASKVLWALQAFQTAVPNATCNNFYTFLTIATEEGMKVGELNRRLGVDNTSTPRALSMLQKRARGRTGYDLVELRPDYEDARIKRCHLTPKGMRLWAQIRKHLE